MAAQSFENGSKKILDFCKILKIHEKILSTTYFLFCFILYNEKMLTDRDTIKIWKAKF